MTATSLRVIGVDPGTTTGLTEVRYVAVGTPVVRRQSVVAVQIPPGHVGDVLLAHLEGEPGLLAVERFVIARGSMRGGAHARGTAELVGDIAAYGERHGWTVVLRNASQVKAWATDARLDRAGLLEACKGMRHARDAARHALFAAVHDGAIPDPLSKEWRR